MLSVFVLIVSTLLSACSEQPLAALKLSGKTMGTTYHITVVHGEQAIDGPAIQALVDKRLQQINQQMSTYIADSELMQFNRLPAGQWQQVSPELFHVLLQSMEISWLTGGAFDVTVGPLVNAWGFGNSGHEDRVPSQSQIDSLLADAGFQNIELNIGSIEISKKTDLQIDLSAIAKGYGVDQLADLLLEQGYSHFMVEVGGELRLNGLNPKGQPWRIAIEQPDGSYGQAYKAIAISDKAVATSGDYRNYFEKDGQRYSHTISPITGKPIAHNLASVTVIADEAAQADGLATAINVMGPEAGLALAQQQGLAIYLLVKTDKGFEAKYSDAFRPYLQ
ncbi:FAD:protein FMN transferase [Dasania sp. GY-MA-18]|uniref:FAD:protein FMN transferase n=2 Tax=Dasania phycosphaerae TaxID=2950436 RepID=A0A9J6RIS3_9GAMM|nr:MULTISPECIES: FAD:protein FMN transferase [Dasania]MCR8921904.1 FAD:protein FMN transferase [Dasania sp. GY-MA-18]MCZ0864332.1 FAD:protein FMN transferase [Dasania phycosphaerae]MCZ0868060.1 FAD:protein FMN transferase [Dasania phycosphaerae]